jgi:signal transduction histidine kinase
MRHHRTLIIFIAAALAVFGALAWITRHALSLEHQRQEARALGQLQERVRLALWRMDSKTSAIIARESARPYFEYQPFYATDRAYSKMLEEVHPGEVLVPSPLLTWRDRFVTLYFQIDSKGAITSPQVPGGNLRDLAEAWYVTSSDVITAEERLNELAALIQPHADAIAKLSSAVTAGARAEVESSIIQSLPLSDTMWLPMPAPADAAAAPVPTSVDGLIKETSTQDDRTRAAAPVVGGSSPLPPAEQRQSASGPEQQSIDEYKARVSAAQAVKESAQIEAQNRASPKTRSPDQPAAPASGSRPPPAAPARLAQEQLDSKVQPELKVAADSLPSKDVENAASQEGFEKDALQAKVAPDAAVDSRAEGTGAAAATMPAGAALAEEPPRDVDAHTPGRPDSLLKAKSTAKLAGAAIKVGSLTAAWAFPNANTSNVSPEKLVAELLLLRDVQLGDSIMRQGCWLNWPALREDLLSSVRDLLPNADVVPITPVMDEGGENLGRRLASVPAELVPGQVSIALAAAWTPLHNTLVLAWAGVLLAIAAIAFLLRAATDLAERRGRFVSAVTHELRTPLTTFVMYSQMLADGMVPEGAARQHYYATLKREAGRLAGIVENVLEFARLSRRKRTRAAPGGGPKRAAELLERLVVPLQQRVEQVGGTLDAAIDGSEKDAATLISSEELTLERILFNLVDNACKYGVVPGGPPLVVTLRLAVEGAWATFTVSDNGPGISAEDRARMFEAFERGVKQADGSIPGLGLGLALSRGLARDVGGDLTLITAIPATFRLRVPI